MSDQIGIFSVGFLAGWQRSNILTLVVRIQAIGGLLARLTKQIAQLHLVVTERPDDMFEKIVKIFQIVVGVIHSILYKLLLFFGDFG